jgi:hypothetical protein
VREEGQRRANREELEGFARRLREFHASLEEPEREMLEVILEGAQAGGTAGYRRVPRRYGEGGEGWEELVGWLREQGEEDTQGFRRRAL